MSNTDLKDIDGAFPCQSDYYDDSYDDVEGADYEEDKKD